MTNPFVNLDRPPGLKLDQLREGYGHQTPDGVALTYSTHIPRLVASTIPADGCAWQRHFGGKVAVAITRQASR